MNIQVLYEDADVLLIDKPAGVTINRSETTKDDFTIQDWSEEHIGIQKPDEGNKVQPKFGEEGWDPSLDFYNRGGIVHRLDKETSGILVLAKTPQAFVNLQKQFHDRMVKKEYRALAHGEITPLEGDINVPVGRLPWNRKSFGILPGGRESKTLYKVLETYSNPKTKETLSFVELYPQSGRTHQIRVHLKYINHPIFGDFLYAGRKTARNDRKILPRVFLHAAKISFSHPVTNKMITFEAPLPQELADCLKYFTKI
jgi:23S rRNA pseudouridine1911/1915/1917 synthase